MATYSTYINKAYVFRLKGTDANKAAPALFDLEKFFRDMATRMGVWYRDNCCDTAGRSAYPVRANEDLDGLEYFDPADSTWKALSL